MPTKNPRINITANERLMKNILLVAEEEGRTTSSMARELIEEALERREDMYLSSVALERDEDNNTTISHKEAWK